MNKQIQIIFSILTFFLVVLIPEIVFSNILEIERALVVPASIQNSKMSPFLENELKSSRIIHQGKLNKFLNKKIKFELNGHIQAQTLRQISDIVFKDHRKLENEALKVKSAFVGRRVDSEEYFIEQDTRIILVKRTHVNIKNPNLLEQRSILWRKYLSKSNVQKNGRVFKNSFSHISRRNSNEIKKHAIEYGERIIPTLNRNHPLAIAYRKGGADGLINAITQGYGDTIITDTITIPKSSNISEKYANKLKNKSKINNNYQYDSLWPEYTHLTIAPKQTFSGMHWKIFLSEMNSSDKNVNLSSDKLTPTSPCTFRLKKINGTSNDYQIAETVTGKYSIINRRSYLEFSETQASHSSVFRLVSAGPYIVIIDKESGKRIILSENGHPKLASNSSIKGVKFMVTESQWVPRLKVIYLKSKMTDVGSPRITVTTYVTDKEGNQTTKTSNFLFNSKGSYISQRSIPRGGNIKIVPQATGILFSPSEVILTGTNDNSIVITPRNAVTAHGQEAFSTQFLAGFTLGQEWNWETEYRYTSGLFRVHLGGDLGVGLRIPIKVSGRFKPTVVTAEQGANAAKTVTSTFSSRAFDADTSFYAKTLLNSNKWFDGQEIVMEAQAYYSLRFRALWKTWVNVPKTTYGFDFSRDYSPAWGDGNGQYRIVIPPELTHSVVDFSVLRGEVKVAVLLAGKAPKVNFDFFSVTDSRERLLGPLVLIPHRPTIKTFPVAPQQVETFGFTIKPSRNNLYTFDLTAVPQVQLRVTASVETFWDDFSRTFGTNWISLNAFMVHLGSPHFGKHPGTRSDFTLTPGRVIQK